MSDPLWFLENLEDNASKSDRNDLPSSYTSQNPSGHNEWTIEKVESSAEDKTEEYGSSQTKENKKMGDNKTTKVFQLDLLKDEDSLRSALKNSLLESIKDVKNPEIQITVNSKPETSTLGNTLDNDLSDTGMQNDKSIVITLKKNNNGKFVGEEQSFRIDNSDGENVVVNESFDSSEQSKVYVILPPENNQPSVDPAISTESNTKYCEEVGSAVINLNDLIDSKENLISDSGNITAKVDLSSIIKSSEGAPKVELVIKVKDERDRPDQTNIPEETSVKNYSESEIARLRELLKSSATLESLESQLQSGKEVNIPISVTPSTSYQTSSTWKTTSLKSGSDSAKSRNSSDPSVDWVDKTTDSYVRRDGSQCTRTVWTSPQGRRVETRCFRDDRKSLRGRKLRNLDWSPRYDSFWSDCDDDFNRIFSYANRFF